jgi:hypothetical protein
MAAARLFPGKDTRCLFQDQIILYGLDPFHAPCDFNRFIDGLLRINEAAQLDDALVGFNPDLEGLEKIIRGKQRFYLGRDDRIVNVFTGTFLFGGRGTGYKGGDQHENHKIADKNLDLFHSGYSFWLVDGEMNGCKALSTDGTGDSAKSFWICRPPPFQIIRLLRQGSKWLKWSSSLNNSDQHHHDGDDQEDVDDSTHRVATYQPQQPQDYKNDTYRPQHVWILSMVRNFTLSYIRTILSLDKIILKGPSLGNS